MKRNSNLFCWISINVIFEIYYLWSIHNGIFTMGNILSPLWNLRNEVKPIQTGFLKITIQTETITLGMHQGKNRFKFFHGKFNNLNTCHLNGHSMKLNNFGANFCSSKYFLAHFAWADFFISLSKYFKLKVD